ncbi:hypothetical protein ACU686_12610 [Yinghuangia aomiensis]
MPHPDAPAPQQQSESEWLCRCGARHPLEAVGCQECRLESWMCADLNHHIPISFRDESVFPDDVTEWQLADQMWEIRASARYRPESERTWRIRRIFTADQAARADAYLRASAHDTGRLTEIEAGLDDTTGHTAWLVSELKTAWARIDTAKDRVDAGCGVVALTTLAAAIGYVPHSRRSLAPA